MVAPSKYTLLEVMFGLRPASLALDIAPSGGWWSMASSRALTRKAPANIAHAHAFGQRWIAEHL
ncbi:MAG: hypothetical protein AVDCRST_MAG87-1162 [uncultured Thermomicrobiales bacterium]|uniref:Uncharacterized protein n=1 Tax=uncultured Thermomicrobiales bacterium TaxID=1645740 RepID=A0A6J4UQF2_9BACT|nr:MAG: hypothetical protein AVDCRST_MAG87-1162 [uncultured Thermomicrobiales bacterium]